MMKKIYPPLLALMFLCLSSFGLHKFYVSVTNVSYSEKEESLQVISRIFIDDLEEVLEARYDFQANLATDDESDQAETYIQRYFQTKFEVIVNGEVREYTFLGKRYENDLVICYIELPDIPVAGLSSVAIRNEILTDLFEEQKNLVHFDIMGKKKSVVLLRENNKGMLNLR